VITGVHAIVFTKDPPGVRAFFADVLGLRSVDAGDGWPIYALPPAELAVHPSDGDGHQQLYLMCNDIQATVKELEGKGVEFTTGIADVGWGFMTRLQLPDGGELPLYEPKHPTPLALDGGAVS
jgi:predicted enzyme related to lactoylglutathione lyase